MKTIFKTQFGSHVYGTNTPNSDLDYKAIFIPDVKDILLQRAPKTIVTGTKEDKNARNTKDDVDLEQFALHQYLELLMQGQTVALDMLFTPPEFWLETSDTWNNILLYHKSFLHKGTTAFIGYARQQAAKYGIKGTRVAAIRAVLDLLNKHNEYHKLNHVDVYFDLYFLVYTNPSDEILQQKSEYIKFVDIRGSHGNLETHLEVCNRKIPLNVTVKYAKSIFQKIFDEYGARALQAEKNEGIDWKALMHAARVCNQAKELLTTAHITFPRPEAMQLLQIRKGELPYKEVAEIIENGLLELEKAKIDSILNEQPDRNLSDLLIEKEYANVVLNKFTMEQK